MKLPKIKNPAKYTGLYIVDFGSSCTVGFTADEVGRLLESEKFKNIKVYKIYNAKADGQMEIKGVTNDLFNLEMAMIFYSNNETTTANDYQQLINAAAGNEPPATAKVQMAKYSDDKYATVIIYPAEYNDEFSSWLTNINYKTTGPAQGGIDAANQYYTDRPQIIRTQQLQPNTNFQNMENEQLLQATKRTAAR